MDGASDLALSAWEINLVSSLREKFLIEWPTSNNSLALYLFLVKAEYTNELSGLLRGGGGLFTPSA